jgi:hypothetical protein
MDKKRMIGTWQLVEFRFTDADGNLGRPEDGPKLGRMEYTADGHMATATRQADGAYFSYFGEFELEGDVVLHHIAMGANPKLDGTTTRRDVSFDGERLVLTANPPVLGGPGSKASLIWERLS